MDEQEQSPQPAGIDLDVVQDVETGDFQVLHPITGEKTGAVFTLMGPEHPDRKRAQLRLMREARADAQRLAAGGQTRDPEEELDESLDELGATIVGWSGVYRAGKPVQFSVNAARELIRDPKAAWLVQQLTWAVRRRELFIKA